MGEAGTEFERRLQAIRAVQGGRPAAAVAREVGRSEWWIHKWLRRWEAEGEAGLRDRSRAPRRRPGATPEEVVDKMWAISNRRGL
jgi:transposase